MKISDVDTSSFVRNHFCAALDRLFRWEDIGRTATPQAHRTWARLRENCYKASVATALCAIVVVFSWLLLRLPLHTEKGPSSLAPLAAAVALMGGGIMLWNNVAILRCTLFVFTQMWQNAARKK